MKRVLTTWRMVCAATCLAFLAAACSAAPAAPAATAVPVQPTTAAKPAQATVAPTSAPAAAPTSAPAAAPTAAPTGQAASSAPAPSGEPINVGIVSTLTGQTAAIGQSLVEGAQVAADQINRSGGVMGRPVNIIPVDAPDPADAIPAVRRMLAVDKVSMVMGMNSRNYQTALPILNEAKMVSFNSITDPALDHADMPYTWRVRGSDSLVGAAMAQYAKNKGFSRLASVFDAEDSAQSLIPPVEQAMKVLGLEEVAKPTLPLRVTSYQGEILQVLGAKPDAILLQLDPEPAGTFFKQLQGLGGGSVPIIGSDFTATSEWITSVGADVLSGQVESVVASSENTPAATQFLAEYQQKFSKAPRNYSNQAYDGVILGSLAMIKAQSIDPTVYVNSIMDVTTPGQDRTVVYNFTDGAKLLAQGKDIKFSGAATPLTFNKNHSVTSAFEVVKAAADGSLTKIADIPAEQLNNLIAS